VPDRLEAAPAVVGGEVAFDEADQADYFGGFGVERQAHASGVGERDAEERLRAVDPELGLRLPPDRNGKRPGFFEESHFDLHTLEHQTASWLQR
jgi:hypothetical protein